MSVVLLNCNDPKTSKETYGWVNEMDNMGGLCPTREKYEKGDKLCTPCSSTVEQKPMGLGVYSFFVNP